jgi:hypothetical protein
MRFGQRSARVVSRRRLPAIYGLSAAVARAADDDPELPLSLEDEANSLDPPSA